MMNSKKFKPQITPTIFCLFFFSLFIYLGIWQIHRYHYKKILISTYQAALIAPPVSISTIDLSHPPLFLSIKITGVFLNAPNILIDHQDNNGQIGYDLITAFQPTHSHKILLVNRGWIPIDSVGSIQTHNLNSKAVILKPLLNQKTLTGYIKLPEYTFILGPNILYPHQSPLVIQKIDLPELEQLEHWKLYPFIMELEPKNPINMLPQRHMAYAVQWFLMALVLAIAYIIFSYSSKRDPHD